MKVFQSVAFALVFLVSGVHAESVTARVVADDFYSVFVGNASGSSMTWVGGSGPTLWPGQGVQFGFNAAAGDYIYVAAWDSPSYGQPHMWIGSFDIAGTMLYSNSADWVAKYDPSQKDPSAAAASTLAQSAGNWLPILATAPNGSAPWGTLIGGAPASMIWHDVFNGTSASESGYALFRTAAPVVATAVPLPATWALMLTGIGLLGLRRAVAGKGDH